MPEHSLHLSSSSYFPCNWVGIAQRAALKFCYFKNPYSGSALMCLLATPFFSGHLKYRSTSSVKVIQRVIMLQQFDYRGYFR